MKLQHFCRTIAWSGLFLLAAAILPKSLYAGTLELSINANTKTNTWQVFATIINTTISYGSPAVEPGDEILGLAGFSIDVLGSGGVTVTSTTGTSPTGIISDPPFIELTGFSSLRFNGKLTGGNVTGIMAIQDLLSSDPSGRRVLEGVGLVAGNDGSTPIPAVWSFPAKLAEGTFEGTAGFLTVQTTALSDLGPGDDAVKLLYGDPSALSNRNLWVATGARPWDFRTLASAATHTFAFDRALVTESSAGEIRSKSRTRLKCWAIRFVSPNHRPLPCSVLCADSVCVCILGGIVS